VYINTFLSFDNLFSFHHMIKNVPIRFMVLVVQKIGYMSKIFRK